MAHKSFKQLFEAARERPEYKRAWKKLEQEYPIIVKMPPKATRKVKTRIRKQEGG